MSASAQCACSIDRYVFAKGKVVCMGMVCALHWSMMTMTRSVRPIVN